MYLGRVLGTCVASEKSPGLQGVRLLVVEPIDVAGRVTGSAFVAADTVSAGPGEVVFLVGAREAALSLDESFVPIDAAIVGLVDHAQRDDLPATFVRGRDDIAAGPLR